MSHFHQKTEVKWDAFSCITYEDWLQLLVSELLPKIQDWNVEIHGTIKELGKVLLNISLPTNFLGAFYQILTFMINIVVNYKYLSQLTFWVSFWEGLLNYKSF